jgi:nucleotidyltransferase substrate binding protein (TIGR01987 family)
MNVLDLTPLKNALKQLEEGLLRAKKEPENELSRDGVIQRFEYSHELAVKFIKRVLEMKHNDNVDQMIYNDILRTAFERGYVKNVEQWFEYRKARNQTSHTYDVKVATHVYSFAEPFLTEAKYLLENLERSN